MPWLTNPADFLSLDLEQQAVLLLEGLFHAPENERGRNFIIWRLQEWFHELGSGVGNPANFPRLQAQRKQATEALEEAYALLLARGLIRGDTHGGTSFAQVTAAGRAQIEASALPDAARVTFARRALEGVELHVALRNRQVDSHFRQGKFETALRDGSVFLEDSVRTLANLDSTLVGARLASAAFADGERLTDMTSPAGERKGLLDLFKGFFGAIRNQIAHRDFRYASAKEAFQALMLLDYLTEKLAAAADRNGQRLL